MSSGWSLRCWGCSDPWIRKCIISILFLSMSVCSNKKKINLPKGKNKLKILICFMSQVILVELKPKLCSACMCFWWPPCCMYQTWLGTLQLWHYLPQKKTECSSWWRWCMGIPKGKNKLKILICFMSLIFFQFWWQHRSAFATARWARSATATHWALKLSGMKVIL